MNVLLDFLILLMIMNVFTCCNGYNIKKLPNIFKKLKINEILLSTSLITSFGTVFIYPVSTTYAVSGGGKGYMISLLVLMLKFMLVI